MAWQELLEQTVLGMGYDLVEIERSAGGLLRIAIDKPYTQGQEQQFIVIEDCERVTRQLQYLLEVEQVDYTRLEVGSPGIDRLLKTPTDFNRFTGHLVDLVLREPIGENAYQISVNRKKFRGFLQSGDVPDQWQIVWTEEPIKKPGQKMSKKNANLPEHVMAFALNEVKEVRLASVVNFKGAPSRREF